MLTLRLGARCLRPTWVTFFVQTRAGDRRNRGCKGTQRFYGFSRSKTFSFKGPSITKYLLHPLCEILSAGTTSPCCISACSTHEGGIHICLWKNLESIYWMFVQKNITGQKRFLSIVQPYDATSEIQTNTKKLNGILKNVKCKIGHKWHIF